MRHGPCIAGLLMLPHEPECLHFKPPGRKKQLGTTQLPGKFWNDSCAASDQMFDSGFGVSSCFCCTPEATTQYHFGLETLCTPVLTSHILRLAPVWPRL